MPKQAADERRQGRNTKKGGTVKWQKVAKKRAPERDNKDYSKQYPDGFGRTSEKVHAGRKRRRRAVNEPWSYVIGEDVLVCKPISEDPWWARQSRGLLQRHDKAVRTQVMNVLL